jgi:two-component system response regulator HydG
MAKDFRSRHWQVLIVDADEMVRAQVGAYFAQQDVPVSTAQDGRAAISTLQRSGGRYGLVVTDLNLPGADGFAVLHAARQANPQCQVIIVAQASSLEAAILGVRVGAADYLIKPFGTNQFESVYTRVVERAQDPDAHDDARPATAGAVAVRAAPAATRMLGPGTPPGAAASAAAAGSLEQRMSRIETMLGRIESRLEAAQLVPARR